MVNFIVELHDEAFLDWLELVKDSFNYMTQTMIQVAKLIKEEVQWRTPLLTGKLSRSYRWTVVTDNSRMKVVQVQMSALNPKTGYDYAWIQHENIFYNHGFTELGFYTYRRYSLDDEYTKMSSTSNYKTHESHHGQSHYLERSIVYSKWDAFEIIEKDYLSLFTEGYII